MVDVAIEEALGFLLLNFLGKFLNHFKPPLTPLHGRRPLGLGQMGGPVLGLGQIAFGAQRERLVLLAIALRLLEIAPENPDKIIDIVIRFIEHDHPSSSFPIRLLFIQNGRLIS